MNFTNSMLEEEHLRNLQYILGDFQNIAQIKLCLRSSTISITTFRNFILAFVAVAPELTSLDIDLTECDFAQGIHSQQEIETHIIESISLGIQTFEKIDHLGLKLDLAKKMIRNEESLGEVYFSRLTVDQITKKIK
jgi:hypothetical protein